ncbi:hypothetical protein C1645_745964 [Glomus cerebriforme]|uniref:Uncharacterized protein n=1 Tax=Glomus cerebriforme TaxID=658196 RepID=A0A397S3H2_9GLOM|nr:hypothetical protein C1645_745964 [Glomus cerebriforme]
MKVLYQVSEITTLPEPKNFSDTASETSEEDLNTPNNPTIGLSVFDLILESRNRSLNSSVQNGKGKCSILELETVLFAFRLVCEIGNVQALGIRKRFSSGNSGLEIFSSGNLGLEMSLSFWSDTGKWEMVLLAFRLVHEVGNGSGFFSISAWKSGKFRSYNFKTFFLEHSALKIQDQKRNKILIDCFFFFFVDSALRIQNSETYTNILTEHFTFFISLLLDLRNQNIRLWKHKWKYSALEMETETTKNIGLPLNEAFLEKVHEYSNILFVSPEKELYFLFLIQLRLL